MKINWGQNGNNQAGNGTGVIGNWTPQLRAAPTVVNFTVKPSGGGDYTSLNSWEVAERANLVSLNVAYKVEVFAGGNSVTGAVSLASTVWITNPTNHIEIYANSAEKHEGVFNTAKVYAEVSANRVMLSQIDLRLIDMQFRTVGAGGSNRGPLACNGGKDSIYVDRCILIAAPTTSTAGQKTVISLNSQTGPNLIQNSILINRADSTNSNVIGIDVFACSLNLYGNTIVSVGIPGAGANTVGVQKASSGTVLEDDNYLSGTLAYIGVASGITQGAHTATEDASAITVGLRNVAYTTANFTSVTSGSEDLHIVTGSALKFAGVAITGMDFDIDNEQRPNPPSIGADDIFVWIVDPVEISVAPQNPSIDSVVGAIAISVSPQNLAVTNGAVTPVVGAVPISVSPRNPTSTVGSSTSSATPTLISVSPQAPSVVAGALTVAVGAVSVSVSPQNPTVSTAIICSLGAVLVSVSPRNPTMGGTLTVLLGVVPISVAVRPISAVGDGEKVPDEITLIVSAPAPTVSYGNASCSLGAVPVSVSPRNLNIANGASTLVLDSLGVSVSPRDLSAISGASTSEGSFSPVSVSPRPLSMIPGAQTSLVGVVPISVSLPTLDSILGEITVELGSTTLLASPEALSVVTGAATLVLSLVPVSVVLPGISINEVTVDAVILQLTPSLLTAGSSGLEAMVNPVRLRLVFPYGVVEATVPIADGDTFCCIFLLNDRSPVYDRSIRAIQNLGFQIRREEFTAGQTLVYALGSSVAVNNLQSPKISDFLKAMPVTAFQIPQGTPLTLGNFKPDVPSTPPAFFFNQ